MGLVPVPTYTQADSRHRNSTRRVVQYFALSSASATRVILSGYQVLLHTCDSIGCVSPPLPKRHLGACSRVSRSLAFEFAIDLGAKQQHIG